MSKMIIAENTATAPAANTNPAPASAPSAAPVTNTAPSAPAAQGGKSDGAKQNAEITKTAPAKENKDTAKKDTKQHTEQPAPAPKKDAPQAPNIWLQMLPFILIFVVMIFFMNRSQKKQMQKRQEMMDKITKGTKVLLTSGIYGTVDSVQDETMVVEIASGVKVKILKNGIADVVTEGENDGAKTENKTESKTESGKAEGK